MSKAGQLKLTYDNFAFYRHSSISGKTFWRCEKYKVHKCKAKAYTAKIGAREMIVKLTDSHTHDPDYK